MAAPKAQKVARPVNLYSAYGLTFQSEFPCPELLPGDGSPDVIVRLGAVPENLTGATARGVVYEAGEDHFLLRMHGVAAYLVSRGEEIVVEPGPGVDLAEIRVFLLGSCLGALLHQRGVLALHASAIVHQGRAVLFAGSSGTGKSTLLAAFLERGYRMLADDITGLVLGQQNRALVLPAFPRTKLWADAAGALDRDLTGLARVRPGLEKFEVPVKGQFCQAPTPLSRVYLLGQHNQDRIEVEPCRPGARLGVLVNHTYRQRFLDGLQMRAPHFHLAAEAARQAEVFRVLRPSHPYRLGELADRLEANFQGATRSA